MIKYDFLFLSIATALVFPGKISISQVPDNTEQVQPIVELEEYVTSTSLNPVLAEDMAVPSSILAGDSLALRNSATLGETLSWEPGVNSTYHGPGASRPIIRGFDGDRIRILKSGVDSLDVSNTSPDHAVSVEPLLVDSIEIVRGPATLLYGSSAIGGIINVIGKEIPSKLPTQPIEGKLELAYGTAANERSSVLSTTGAVGPVAWHIGLLARKSDDVEIPGFADAKASPDSADGNLSGILLNSAIETTSGSAGFAWFWDKGSVGFAVSALDSLYGIPEGNAETPVRIELDQLRFDFRAELLEPMPFLESIKLRSSYADYEHSELEGEEVGTEFLTNGFEIRIEALHKPLGFFEGAFGLQLRQTDFEANGEEAFLPPSKTLNWALFVVEKINYDLWNLEGGVRLENQNISVTGREEDTDHLAASASIGLVFKPNDDYRAAFSLGYSQRIPTSQELFANGPHAATKTFESGDPSLGIEEALGLDFSVRKTSGFLTGSINLFYNKFNNFVSLEPTNEQKDNLPVFDYLSQSAEFYGAEMEASLHILHHKGRHLHMDFLLDFIRANNTDMDSPLPRIPPLRLGGRLRYDTQKLRSGLEMRIVDSQKRITAFETPTSGYTFLNADITYSFSVYGKHFEVFAVGTNLNNEEARNHVSFIKDQAPLPGRNIKTGFRVQF